MEWETFKQLVYRRPTEEVVTEALLKEKFEQKKLKHYIGYELSGLIHIGSITTASKAIDLAKAGFETNILLADYHSWINKKLGGDLELIREVAFGYFKPMFEAMGIKANYILASTLYDNDYWKLVLELANNATLNRVKRTLTIMGREESESNPTSFFIYPLMQSADIIKLNIDLAHAGMDQRKVHMLVIEMANKLGFKKPVALHTHLLPALNNEGRMDIDAKMSKSKAKGAIFIHDDEELIYKKIKEAFCPLGIIEGNPVIEILKNFLILDDNTTFTIERPSKYGGDITLTMPEFEELYKQKKIHPSDLKNFVANALIKRLAPARALAKKHSIAEYIELIKEKRSR